MDPAAGPIEYAVPAGLWLVTAQHIDFGIGLDKPM